MSHANYYTVLQVAPNADCEVVEAAYKRLAFKYHPDRNRSTDSAIKMRELNQAYETLRDPTKRRLYDQEMQSDESVKDLYQKVNHLLDLNCSQNEIITSLVDAGMELETSARVVGTIIEHRRQTGVREQHPEKVLAQYRADNGKIVVVYVISALLVIVGLGFALFALFGKPPGNPGLGERFLLGMIFLGPALALSGFMVLEAKKHWNEELVVYASRLQWQIASDVRSFELSGIKSITVVAGEGIIEFALQFINIVSPELVIVDSNDAAWRIKGYMEKMDELCQVVPSLWTAHDLGLR